MKILVYIAELTPRVKYTFNLIFRDILGVSPEFTCSREDFNSFEGIKISYHPQPLANELHFASSSFLFEKGINRQISANQQDDPIAWTFVLTSRYEEYLPHKKDNYQRFEASSSELFHKNLIRKPVVNILALQIKQKITDRYPAAFFPEKKYRFIPTIDVDNAFAYRGKGLMRTAGAYARDIMRWNRREIANRTGVILGRQKDPFDVFDFLVSVQNKYDLRPVYFFLLADYGLNDKNVSHSNKKFQSLIKSISDYAEVGIHPSFNSGTDKEKLKTEIMRLSDIIHKDITQSRQHFLRLQLPETYRNLINLGITDDYTMGYAPEPGFRAGICTPYYFYDLLNESETNLRIHPFCLMEATLKYYKNILPGNAMEYMKPVIDEVKKVNGTLYTLWHNDFLSEMNEFAGWKNVFTEMVEYAR